MLHNPNNWHWVNKDVSPWAREYLEKNLVGIEGEQKGSSAKIINVTSMDGDVDVSQRKGKVITLFDVNLKLGFEGKTETNEDVSGTITVPEVAHDTEEHEYVFEIDVHSDSNGKQPVKDVVKAVLVPQLRRKLYTLAPALIKEHGKDIQHAPGSGPSSGYSTPLQTVTSSTSAQSTAKGGKSSTTASADGKSSVVNTTTLNDSTEFRTTAAELYQTFTDSTRIAAFTRSAPRVFEGAKPGGKFELFGGNVTGEYVSLQEPKQVVQRWRLAQWPAGHFSTLKITFDQNDRDGVTVMRVTWEGVPIGQEEVTRRNWGEYYVRSIKTTFGFGAVL